MAHITKNQTTDAVLWILEEVKQQGYKNITRTTLTKFLYLLDYWVAIENKGKTFIGVEWKFHHYGPYSDALIADIDWLSTLPSINKVDVAKNDKEFILYGLSEYAKPKPFDKLGLAADIKQKMSQVIKKYAMDLNGLLNFVYFETEPMHSVKPGDILSFSNLSKVNFKNDVMPVKFTFNNKDKALKIKELLNKIGNKWDSDHNRMIESSPPIRDAYFAETIESHFDFDSSQEFVSSLNFEH